jgi:hypothetical protein
LWQSTLAETRPAVSILLASGTFWDAHGMLTGSSQAKACFGLAPTAMI